LASFWNAVGRANVSWMWRRTGTFFHGFMFTASRIIPAGMSIVPGVATPIAETRSMPTPAADAAARIVSHMRRRPNSWPRSASVGKATPLSGRPDSSTTPAFMVVPPTSRPI
jgi:hypothetical protein